MSGGSHTSSPLSAPLARRSQSVQEPADALGRCDMPVVGCSPLTAAVRAVALLLMFCLQGFSANGLAQSSSSEATGLKFEYSYDVPADPNLREIHARLSSRDPLAKLGNYLSPLRLPHKLIVRTRECGDGQLTRAYSPGNDLIFCYEYLQRAERLARNAKDPDPNSHRDIREVVAEGAFAHAILHLVAHATFDQLQTPLWGNRYDAADRLASYAMIRLNPEQAADWFVGAGMYFALSGAEAPADFRSLSTPDSQRFYDHLCFAQLADPQAFAKLVSVVAERIFDGADAEKLAKVFRARAMTDTAARMKEVAGLDPNDKIFHTQFYRRMLGCSQEANEARIAFDLEIRPHLAVDSAK